MITSEAASILGHSTLTRYVTSPGERDQLYARARVGELTRVYRGCYVETQFWLTLSPDARHRARAHLATLGARTELEFSHLTAVALWRLPVLGEWPSRPHVSGAPGADSRRSGPVARHALGRDPSAVAIDGLRATSLALTVAQTAATSSFAAGVVVADAALRRGIHPLRGFISTVSTADLARAASMIAASHGGVRSLAVAAFADGAADRPGESVSRANMRAAGLRIPQLQVALYGASGARYFVDFYWPCLRLVGEFDGRAKYEDPEFLRGRTPAQALADEKFREDDLRAAGYSFTRWGWTVALSAARLATQLRRAGVQ